MVIEQCYRNGLPLPTTIQNAPQLTIGLEMYYKAFFDLTTCRTGLHGTEGPIVWTAVIKWAETYELDEEQRDDLVHHIGQMDEVYLRFKTKKLEAGDKASKRGKR